MALSDKEQDILAGLERELASDPQFVTSMTQSHRMHFGSGKRIITGTLALVGGITLLLVGITSHLIVLGVLGFAVMVAGAFWAFSGNPPANQSSPYSSGGAPVKAKSSFMKNLEDKWEERRNSQNN